MKFIILFDYENFTWKVIFFIIYIQRYRNEYIYVLTIINYYTTFVSLFPFKINVPSAQWDYFI